VARSARTVRTARCRACGHEEPRWVGRCSGCGEWGTVEEVVASGSDGPRPAVLTTPATALRDLDPIAPRRRRTGIGELDRVLGGGLVPGSVALLGGEPGIGKSTLLLQACAQVAAEGRRVLYVSAEESVEQVHLRASRLGIDAPDLLLAADTSVGVIEALAARHEPALLVVDSIQTVTHGAHDNAAGSVVQVRESATALTRLAKTTGIAIVLVGHVTKDGVIAGPRTLEHLVDVVLSFEGDRHHALRLLRGLKNRFGPAGEVGCFEMVARGLAEVTDPSRLFRTDHEVTPSGVALTVTIEGPRPLLVEVQALANDSVLASPRRQAAGLDRSRVSLLVAVLEERAGVDFAKADVYASAVGGLRLREPATDLPVALALASARAGVPVRDRQIAIGEVGLAGEVRAVPSLDARLAEAGRLGIARALVPRRYDGPAHGIELVRVGDLASALREGLVGVPAIGTRVDAA